MCKICCPRVRISACTSIFVSKCVLNCACVYTVYAYLCVYACTVSAYVCTSTRDASFQQLCSCCLSNLQFKQFQCKKCLSQGCIDGNKELDSFVFGVQVFFDSGESCTRRCTSSIPCRAQKHMHIGKHWFWTCWSFRLEVKVRRVCAANNISSPVTRPKPLTSKYQISWFQNYGAGLWQSLEATERTCFAVALEGQWQCSLRTKLKSCALLRKLSWSMMINVPWKIIRLSCSSGIWLQKGI